MISVPWDCGETYYLHHELKQLIETIHYAENDEIEDKKIKRIKITDLFI